MKSISSWIKLLMVAIATTGAARATVILDLSSSLTLADPTQLGRLSRNGIPQDWAGGEPFPGVFNPATTYHYHTYSVNVGLTPFIQIEFDSGTNLFVSAYDTTYNPAALATNWLGDPGLSGNFFPGDPQFFQVIVPANHNLIIVVNNTAAANVGVGDPFRLTVEGFIDTEFTDLPEPATLFLCSGGLALLLVGGRIRSRLSRFF